MQPLLKIASAYLDPDNTTIGSFDLTGRCAFAICTEGEFTIRILNERYVVKSRDMFACMPFVNVEILDVIKPSEIIFTFVKNNLVPMMINI